MIHTCSIFVPGVEKPFGEDEWTHVRIGSKSVFRNAKLCSRCIFTTVDPEKGKKRKDMEPLLTLKSFRYDEDYVYSNAF